VIRLDLGQTQKTVFWRMRKMIKQSYQRFFLFKSINNLPILIKVELLQGSAFEKKTHFSKKMLKIFSPFKLNLGML